jgi:adenylyltransferase/sulfurtransferase
MSKNYHARQELLIGKTVGERIKATKILIVGVGAAGNEILKNLALIGFRRFTIIDFDTIEDSNLSRTTLFQKSDVGKLKAEVAAKRLEEYILHETPEINTVVGNVMTNLGKGAFKEHDIVICCVDTLIARAYLDDWCNVFQTPLFEVGFRGFSADITLVHNENETSPRLRDIIGYQEFDEKRNSCSGLIAKDTNLQHIPTIQSTSAVAGGLMATEIVKYIQGNPSLKGKILKYNGLMHRIDIFKLMKNNDATTSPILEGTLSNIHFDNQVNVRTILEYLNAKHKDFFVWRLPYTFLESWSCKVCKKKISPRKWHRFIHEEEMDFGYCPEGDGQTSCQGTGNLELLTELHLNSENKYLDRTLSSFGIPSNDLLTFQGIEHEERVICHLFIR